MRKIIYLFLSIFLIFSSVTSSYAAGSAWKVTNAVSRGARVVVSATNSGFKSAVNIAPNVGRVGLKLARVGNGAYLAIAVAGLLGDGIDWVMDPANNEVKYKRKGSTAKGWTTKGGVTYATAEEAGDAQCASLGKAPRIGWYYGAPTEQVAYPYCSSNGLGGVMYRDKEVLYERVSVANVSNSLINKAKSGDRRSRDILKEVAIEAVVAGDFDRDLMAGAVPVSDNKPVVPAIPGSQTGDVGEGTLGGGDVGAVADAARDASDAAKKAADAAINAAADAANDARITADEAKDLINQAVDKAIKDAARDAAIESAADAVDAQKVANEAVRAADKAAAEAVRTADKAAAEAVRTADKAAAERDAAVAAGESAEAIAKAEAKAAAATSDKVAAEAAAEAAKDKAKEAEKAKEKAKEEVKPFELPAFCTWASEVCEFMDWVKKEPVMDDVDGIVDIEEPSETMHEGILERMYISMPAECPADPTIEFMGTKIPFPMYIFCQFAAMMKPLILLFAYIKGLSIIGTGLS